MIAQKIVPKYLRALGSKITLEPLIRRQYIRRHYFSEARNVTIFFLVNLLLTAPQVNLRLKSRNEYHLIKLMSAATLIKFIISVVQVYVALLVRTEARKLANNSNFEFVNNTAEATCSMDMPGTNNVATIPI